MESLYTYAITYFTWTQTGPVLAHLRNVYWGAANCLIIQENTTVAKWFNYISVKNTGRFRIKYVLWGINVWTQDLWLVYLGSVAWNRGTQARNVACGSWQSRGALTSRLNRGLRLPAMGQSRGSSAGQVRGECGTSSALVRRKCVEPRLAALVGLVYIRDRSFKG